MPETFPPPSARPWLRRVSALLLVALVVVLAACSSDGSSSSAPAITVGTHTISQSTVEEQLSALGKNPQTQAQATTKGKVKPDVAANWLSLLVQMQVAKAAVMAAKQSPNASDKKSAAGWAQGYFGSAAALNAFPKSFRDRVEEQYSWVRAYERLHSKEPTEAEMQKAYSDSIARGCASGRYVSRIVTKTQAEAQNAADRVKGGQDFSTLAALASTDNESAHRGGAMGCLDSQSVDPSLTSIAAATPLGEVSAPFKGTDGWEIVKVEDVAKVLAYDKVKSDIRDELLYDTAGRDALAKLVATAKVKVAPKYGRWVVTAGSARVEAPNSAGATPSSTPATTAPPTSTP